MTTNSKWTEMDLAASLECVAAATVDQARKQDWQPFLELLAEEYGRRYGDQRPMPHSATKSQQEALAEQVHKLWIRHTERMFDTLSRFVCGQDVPHVVNDRLSGRAFDPMWHPEAQAALDQWRSQASLAFEALPEDAREQFRYEAELLLATMQPQPAVRQLLDPDCCANCEYLRWGTEDGADRCDLLGSTVAWGVKQKRACTQHKRCEGDPRTAASR